MTSRLSSVRDVAAALNVQGAHGLMFGALMLAIGAPTLLAGGSVFDWGRYARDAIALGEWWRLVSCHFVHFDRAHALANLLGFVLVWSLVARTLSVRQWLLCIVCSIGAVSAGLWWLSPRVQWYVGASGFLHGLLICGAVVAARSRDRLAWLVLLIVAAKLGYEQWSGALPFSGEMLVVTDAHLYGAVGGLLAAMLLRGRGAPL